MTDYALELVNRSTPTAFARSVSRARALYQQYGGWIDRYRGGVPAGVMATVMMWESDGKPGTVGDASLGEYGLYQIAAYVPALFGIPESARYTPEVNVFLGAMELQYESARWKAKYPNYVELGSLDSYKLARLSFSVGAGGAWGLAANAINAGYANGRPLYDACVAYVDATGGVPLGSQSADKVWFRTKSIALQFEIASQVGGFFDIAQNPARVTPPPGITYTIPPAVAPYFSSGFPWLIFGALGLGGYALWRLV